MNSQYLSHLKCNYEFKREELKSKHKIDLSVMKKNNASLSEIKKLKENQKLECVNLKSCFDQSKKQKPRLEENWIPLGTRRSQLEQKLEIQEKRVNMPILRNQCQLKSVENNIKFQNQRREKIQAAIRLNNQIKKKIRRFSFGIPKTIKKNNVARKILTGDDSKKKDQ
ncbi:unnamed protein product [Brachionus calyciflorus]|uniref:Uncharacterized protein n=1 Tax=Brachionus calyciflorus TaxID=104777 RepID=A0A813V6J1_9BILA|nr:unnamed protein product [Brachionus calyciflorus]